MRVLVVDDNPIIIESCRRVLEMQKIAPSFASTVKTGEAMLKTKHFDLLLTDIKMPGEDGFEMITRLKACHPEVPVLIMTGYLIPEIINKGRSLGVTHFIAKPFTPGELLDAVQKAR